MNRPALVMLLMSIHCAAGGALVGRASWYGYELAGECMANGQLFEPMAMTCAHRKLPFGTVLHVTNMDNGKTVVVTVTDRGPSLKTRCVLDLSLGAFRAIDDPKKGHCMIKYRVVK